MSSYRTWIDPRAVVTRNQLRSVDIRDFDEKCMRWALHLSDLEFDYLERMNPDTLGCLSDPALYKAEWAKFVNSPAARPFKVFV